MPMSVDAEQPFGGAVPPNVFSRWIKAVRVNLAPPVGPCWSPTTSSKSQGIAPSSTKSGSEDEAMALAQTALVSFECCQVARGMPSSSGLGLRKCVMICLVLSLNNVACGPNNVQAKPEVLGQMEVLGFGHGKQI